MISAFRKLSAASAVALVIGAPAFADTISPTSYSDTLDMGESVTIRKTVVVEASGPSDAIIDAYFLIDTSGSMGGVISAAKTAAADIFGAITTEFGSDVAGGVGVYSENAGLPGDTCAFFDYGTGSCSASGSTIKKPGSVLNQDVTTTQSDVTTAISQVTLNDPDYGGDGPENVIDALKLVADNATWRPGSNRFIFTFSDATGKGLAYTAADAIGALNDQGITLVALSFSGSSHLDYMSSTFGGSVDFQGFNSGTSAAAIVAAVTAGITGGFATYSGVTVDDLGGGGPIDVSAMCVSADTGACEGDTAVGAYDRTVDRKFEFDVTFKRTGAGDVTFPTFALVDGGAVAREIDSFKDGGGVPAVPLPAAGWLLIAGLGGLAAMKRRKAA